MPELWLVLNVSAEKHTNYCHAGPSLSKLCNMHSNYIVSKERRLVLGVPGTCITRADARHGAAHREQDKSMRLQSLEDVKEQQHLIEGIQPQVGHYTQDGVN